MDSKGRTADAVSINGVRFLTPADLHVAATDTRRYHQSSTHADVREMFAFMRAIESDDAYTGVPTTDGTLSGIDVETKESRSRFQQFNITDKE